MCSSDLYPVYSSLMGFWDGLYSSFWLDGFLSGVSGPGRSPAWNDEFMLAMALPPIRGLLKRYVFPKSGQGPSQSVRDNGYFDLILVGKLGDSNIMRARVKGDGDPGTESTSRLLVESALCLAQDSDRIAVGGGFWTPASAMGELLLQRLTDHGVLSLELD